MKIKKTKDKVVLSGGAGKGKFRVTGKLDRAKDLEEVLKSQSHIKLTEKK